MTKKKIKLLYMRTKKKIIELLFITIKYLMYSYKYKKGTFN